MFKCACNFIPQHKPVKKMWLLSGFLCVFPAAAQVPAPSQEFWDYMADYSDDTGEIIDPADLDQLHTIAVENSDDVSDKEPTLDVAKPRRANMKMNNATSVQSSSMKGESL